MGDREASGTGPVKDAAEHARYVLADEGPHVAWLLGTRNAIDAHLANDAEQRAYWAEFQRELRRIAPRPGTTDRDIESSARAILYGRTLEEALNFALVQEADNSDRPIQFAMWSRIYEALARRLADQSRKDG